MTNYLTLTPRDPLTARDGRPFGASAGNRMRSLDWLYPSVVAGSLRTLLGKQTGGVFDAATVEKLRRLEVSGPFPSTNERLFFPRPLDYVVRQQDDNRECLSVRPVDCSNGEGCDLPGGLRPALVADSVEEDFKPADVPAFWSRSKMVEWLLHARGAGFPTPPEARRDTEEHLNAPPKEIRTHVKMDPNTGAGAEGQLFSTTGLDLSRKCASEPVRIAVRVEARGAFEDALGKLDALHPLGGERRLVHWQTSGMTHSSWDCPAELKPALRNTALVRMVLATPALFNCGWKPEWLKDGQHALQGSPPGSTARLRLVSAVVERWQPFSGWSLENGSVGPKPVRRMVPAGSVYFFEVTDGDPGALATLWLKSVCDQEQDGRDGFGLALWGIWDKHGKEEGFNHD